MSYDSDENIAHIDEYGRIQLLEDHLVNVARLSEEFGSVIGIGKIAYLSGLLHDLGKADADFVEYIMDDESQFKRGDIDHSTAGAQYLSKQQQNIGSSLEKYALEMAEIAIMSHHGGLMDCLKSDGTDNLSNRLQKPIPLESNLCRINKNIISEADSVLPGAISEASKVIERITEPDKPLETKFQYGLLNRFLLSCLIDADRIDTICFNCHKGYRPERTDWFELRDRLEEHVRTFKGNDDVSIRRREVSEMCLKAASRETGIFTLTVPTGGGKTLSVFRFALNHLIEHGMDRIIVVVPYLSIIEQNVAVMRKVLEKNPGDSYITECHSNLDVGRDSEGDGILDEGTDSWDEPIIFTSMVQFLETLFSSGTRKVRRMHNLANSVIIFDEMQSLPVKTTYMFNTAISFLTKHCGSTVVLSTATQPLLNGGIRCPLEFDDSSEIVADRTSLFAQMKRTRIEYLDNGDSVYDAVKISQLALRLMESKNNILIIVNTKKMARDVYKALKYEAPMNTLLYHLSTNMCPAHRVKKLSEIREKLLHERLVCVSTQLIEAGIDIDFECVIRSLAGLDSIAQAAGRCNRHGHNPVGDVVVVKTDEQLGQLVDIYEGSRCSDLILRDAPEDPLSPDVISRYFDMYFYEREKDMCYPTCNQDESLYEMLSVNRNAINTYKSINKTAPPIFSRQSFKTANSQFSVIDRMMSVVVPYDDFSREAVVKLNSYRTGADDLRSILRSLQRYSVNTYRLNDLLKKGIVYEVIPESEIFCLKDDYYDEDIGIVEEPNGKTMIF